MRKRFNKLTDEQKEQIRELRFSLSMIDMAQEIDTSYHQVQKFMVENNLQLTKEQVLEIKLKKMRKRPKVEKKKKKNNNLKDHNLIF